MAPADGALVLTGCAGWAGCGGERSCHCPGGPSTGGGTLLVSLARLPARLRVLLLWLRKLRLLCRDGDLVGNLGGATVGRGLGGGAACAAGNAS